MLAYHELFHLLLSLFLGAFIFMFYRNKLILLYSFFAGFFIDADHLIDYFIFKKEFAFNFVEFTNGHFFDQMGKVYLLLHGYEYALILAILGLVVYRLKKSAKNQLAGIFFVLSLSMAFHLLFDQYSYKPKPMAYSITYRILNNFDHDQLGFK